MEKLDEEPEDEVLPPIILSKALGTLVMDEFEHDPFIDEFKGRSIWEYPEDAP